jgi:cytochrome c peroxidase
MAGTGSYSRTERQSPNLRRKSLRRVGVALTALTLSMVAVAAAAPKTAPHGAAAMAEQEAALDKLLVGDLTKTPQRVDPAIWNHMIPKDNAPTKERIALGRKLYFDTRLSADGTVSCATCHDVTRGFTDQRATSEGIGNQIGKRNSPTTLNAALFQTQFLDGREPTLEEQAEMPILNPIEMGQKSEQDAVKAIAGIPEYQQQFQAAYGRAVNFEDIARAIAAFERTLIFLDAPFDRFLEGDGSAISADAKAGWTLFNGKGRCMSCHTINRSNPLGSDNRFHNVGVSARHQDFEGLAKRALEQLAKDDSDQALDRMAIETDLSELGRFLVTRQRSDIGAFKTSQLRNVGITAPYMHDGSLPTLWDVMDHYNKGGEPNGFLDGGMEALALTEKEIDQLVALMFSMTDVRFKAQNDAQLRKQRAQAQKQRPMRDNELATRRVLDFEKRIRDSKKVKP